MEARGVMDAGTVSKLILYCPHSGKARWAARGREWFKSDDAMKRWNGRNAGKEIGTKAGRYLSVTLLGKSFRAHRLVWAAYYGAWPKGQIDHINGNGTDNRLVNLRDVAPAENQRNVRRIKPTKSGVMGVVWDAARGKWAARVKVNGKMINLGRFDALSDAVEARRVAVQAMGFGPSHGAGA